MENIIGIVPKGDLQAAEESNMKDRYFLLNNYIKRVTEAGGIALGVAPVDGWVPPKALEMFDGFVVQGGSKYFPYHFQIIHHAVETGKPYLGICLGMQLIRTYFMLRHRVAAAGYEGDLLQAIWELQCNKDFDTLDDVAGHYSELAPRGREEEAKHEVSIVPGTLLHRLLGRETARGATYHKSCVPGDESFLTINARAADGTIEGVEYKDHILGVQFHPEVDDKLPELFRFVVEYQR